MHRTESDKRQVQTCACALNGYMQKMPVSFIEYII